LGGAVPRAAVRNPDDLTIRTYVDNTLAQTSTTTQLVRSVAQLIADVTEFMTLQPGDILAVGVARPPPRVRPGQRVDIAIDGFPPLSNRFEAEVG
jgi:5-oxopent-3-ene-1,2,5-tricarboxylate decarboxylase/2-hydroxyhepta-2,4-diene-1,7-dioate isomerase